MRPAGERIRCESRSHADCTRNVNVTVRKCLHHRLCPQETMLDTVQSSAANSRPQTREPLGRVISISGSQARIGLLAASRIGTHDPRATVGKFIGIRSGRSLQIGLITEVTAQSPATIRDQGHYAIAHLDLMGEIKEGPSGTPHFVRGVREYPSVGDPADLIGSRALRLIYDISGNDTINIGTLNQDPSVGAYVHVDEMVSKHFAVLGTTGVGKSSGVALLLQQILEARPELRIFLVDAHNEYGRCFGDRGQVVNPRNLKLPFWLFNFEEIIDVIFGARPGIDEEVEILAEVIPMAKANYTRYRSSNDRLAAKRNVDPRSAGFTVDTPVPYLLADMLSLIDERMGKLENRSSRMVHHKLMQRIETIRNDPRYAFMFENANVGGDTMAEVLGELFRLPPNGRPMTIMQLAGFPAEVIDAVMSVLCRMAFDFGLWSDGAVPLLFVCEEAHRYASADRTIGFGPTRRALSRIAKEGRKYGVFLGLVTQRPAELDPTILSQCSTLFVMRMSNDRDQALVRAAVSDAAANLLTFVPSLGTREVFAFGEGVALPVRLTFKELPQQSLPASEALGDAHKHYNGGINQDFIMSVVERWRRAMTSQKQSGAPEHEVSPVERTVPLTPVAQPPAPERPRLLKKPLAATDALDMPERPAASHFGR
jgi:DNA helicase HerA-like ATPase